MLVQFSRQVPPYRTNEIAGFTQREAEYYEEMGAGKIVKTLPPVAAAQSVDEAPLVLIRFRVAVAPYRTGEVAGFPEPLALEYCALKQRAPGYGPVAERLSDAEVAALEAQLAEQREEAAEEETGVLLRFLQQYPPYRTGEVAGFSKEKAEGLLSIRNAKRKPIVELVGDVDLNPPAPREMPHVDLGLEVHGLTDKNPQEANEIKREQEANSSKAIKEAKDKMIREARNK